MEVVRLFVVGVLLATLPAVADAQMALQPPRLQRRVAAIRLQSMLGAPAGPEAGGHAADAMAPRRWGVGLEAVKGSLPDFQLRLTGPIKLRVVLGRAGASPRSSVVLIWQL